MCPILLIACVQGTAGRPMLDDFLSLSALVRMVARLSISPVLGFPNETFRALLLVRVPALHLLESDEQLIHELGGGLLGCCFALVQEYWTRRVGESGGPFLRGERVCSSRATNPVAR